MPDAPAPPPPPGSPATPPPRAFAQGTGVLLQTVGMILFFCSCCICALTPTWDERITSPMEIEQAIRDNRPGVHSIRAALSSPARAGYVFTVTCSTLGGLALAGFGLGLQADRGRSALGAVATAVGVESVLLLSGVGLWVGSAPIPATLLNLLMLLVYAILLAFCVAAYRQVKATPPPADIDIVPPGTKIPYSFYHDDPPDVRLARDIAARQAKLDAEQKELDRLQRELDSKRDDKKKD